MDSGHTHVKCCLMEWYDRAPLHIFCIEIYILEDNLVDGLGFCIYIIDFSRAQDKWEEVLADLRVHNVFKYQLMHRPGRIKKVF